MLRQHGYRFLAAQLRKLFLERTSAAQKHLNGSVTEKLSQFAFRRRLAAQIPPTDSQPQLAQEPACALATSSTLPTPKFHFHPTRLLSALPIVPSYRRDATLSAVMVHGGNESQTHRPLAQRRLSMQDWSGGPAADFASLAQSAQPEGAGGH
jgi:hypothetical protein